MAFDSTGTNSTGSGTYAVTGGVAFTVVPGSTPAAGTIDSIGNPDDSRSGLLILRVRYSDGEDGVLTVSCHGGGAVPETIFEGITATKGFVGYVDRGKPEAGVDQNRTAFHVLAEGQVDCDHDDDDDGTKIRMRYPRTVNLGARLARRSSPLRVSGHQLPSGDNPT